MEEQQKKKRIFSAIQPTGVFTLSNREKWHTFGSTGYARFALKYASGVYMHGPLYYTKNIFNINPRYYDGDHYIGGANSGGCLRMVVKAIRWIYEKCPDGTKLKIVNGSPLGSSSDPVPPRNGHNYDPTDEEALAQLTPVPTASPTAAPTSAPTTEPTEPTEPTEAP